MSNFPVLIFAHRSNTPCWVDYAIQYGANAIESDIYLGKDGQQIWAAHDPVAPGTKLEEFLNHVSQKLRESDQIVLWLFDLKSSMTQVKFVQLRTMVNECFPTNVWKFYCISENNKNLVEPYLNTFGDMEGINYDATVYTDNVSPEEAYKWKQQYEVKNFIYSAGIDALLTDNDIKPRLSEAVNLRQCKQDFGIYTWTFDRESTAIKTLKDYRLNGIMGNMNKKFGNIPKKINEGTVSGVRLATRSDGSSAFCTF